MTLSATRPEVTLPRARRGLSLRSSGRTEIGNAIAGTEYDAARNREFAFWRQTWIRGLGMHGSLAAEA